jgi:hypothetical protein
MTVMVHLPAASEAAFQRAFGDDLNRAALEALCIEGYRAGKLSLGEVSNALDLETSVFALQWLGEHGVAMNYSSADFAADQETLAGVMKDANR